ncbi:MAG TPA: hypothetical protein VNT57_02920, partial [Desulfobacteria bacterium]|nr:hypothetical protein [Desulfobacteria bacterium]
PFFAQLRKTDTSWKELIIGGTVCLIALSFFINYRSANNSSVWHWNGTPLDVNEHYSRVWDWSDIPFLR